MRENNLWFYYQRRFRHMKMTIRSAYDFHCCNSFQLVSLQIQKQLCASKYVISEIQHILDTKNKLYTKFILRKIII